MNKLVACPDETCPLYGVPMWATTHALCDTCGNPTVFHSWDADS